MEKHNIPPLYDNNSQILILGSFPSVKSREAEFFYGHPQNRFWRVLATVFQDDLPETVPEKKAFLLSHGVALWDVIASCDIQGSADSTITNVKVNDLKLILDRAPIKKIFVNGRKAESLYKQYIEPVLQRPACYLPSTSPANAATKLPQLVEKWQIIR